MSSARSPSVSSPPTPSCDQQNNGLFYGGGLKQLGLQVLGPVAVGVYSFIVTWIIAKIIDKTMGFRIPAEEEVTGIDITSHAETGYDLGTIHSSGVAAVNGPVARHRRLRRWTHETHHRDHQAVQAR